MRLQMSTQTATPIAGRISQSIFLRMDSFIISVKG
jgi:hypothetical protein